MVSRSSTRDMAASSLPMPYSMPPCCKNLRGEDFGAGREIGGAECGWRGLRCKDSDERASPTFGWVFKHRRRTAG